MREFTLKVRGNRTKMRQRDRGGDGPSETEAAMVRRRQRRRWFLGYIAGDQYRRSIEKVHCGGSRGNGGPLSPNEKQEKGIAQKSKSVSLGIWDF